MTLQQLRYVIMIADCGSMNEAVKQLFISQPSLSETIKELELEIGFDIFLRSNRGIVITPEGEEFLTYAKQVSEQYRLLEEKYIEKKSKKKFSVSMQHYTFSITDVPVAGHSEEMKSAACSEKGLASVLLGAKVLSFTALDLLEDHELLTRIKEEHKRLLQEQS